MCKACPRCGTPMMKMVTADAEWECPACDLSLSAWASSFIERTLVPPKEHVDVETLAKLAGSFA